MILSNLQKQVIANDIDANPTLAAQPMNLDGHQFIADFYNAIASPAFWVWRTSVFKDEYTEGVGPEGTVFNWTGTGFITRSQGERDAWSALFGSDDMLDANLLNVRQAFADIFSGVLAPGPANLAHINAVSRRLANVVEKLLATGTGSTASPATMGAEGTLTIPEVQDIRENF